MVVSRLMLNIHPKKVALEETDDVTSTKGDEVEVLKTQKEDKKAQVAESSLRNLLLMKNLLKLNLQ